MSSAKGYAAMKVGGALVPFNFERREPGDRDVVIDLLYCGICHSDLHQVKNEWGGSFFPMVPGHEMVGRVTRVGSSVKRFKVGDHAGVGCFVGSCRQCENCKAGNEQYCSGVVWSYNAIEADGKTRTYGGYSTSVVANEDYTLQISPDLPLDRAAPLLCAGITTYSPLRHWKVGKGSRVAINGLGGLGHMGVKLAVSMGADVTVLSTSKAKEADAKRLGAQHFVVTKDTAALEKHAQTFDFVLDTVSAPHDINGLLGLLKTNGVWVVVGIPPEPSAIHHFSLIGNRRSFAGSLIGGIRETQEMLDYCAKNKVLADVEVIPASGINTAYERMLAGDVRYRFVIDTKTI